MVDTIKFSQMTSGGDIANNETTPGLQSGLNVLFNNPWTFLAPGTTAQRPVPSSAINYRLRLNTDTQIYEYYDAVLAMWVQLQQLATIPGPFVTYTADVSLPGAQNLGALANGILKQTITTGSATLNIAVNGTDYYGPGFVIPGTDGGTGINNGALTINLGTATTGFVLTSDSLGNATWQSVSASGGITTIDGDSGAATALAGVVTISGASTGLTFTGSSYTLSLGGVLALASGGTNANLTAALGGVPYSTASAIALLAPGTTGQLFQSGGAGAPTWTTTTYPATNAINTIMYASSANVLGVVTPVNSAVLISSAGGVPSFSTTLPASLTIPSPKVTTAIYDTNGNIILGLSPVASAVNYIAITNSATGNALGFGAAGSDTNITMSLTGKGNGGVQRQGLMTGGGYSVGFAGEVITSNVSANSVPLSNNTNKDITTISVTAGVWAVYPNIFFTASIAMTAGQAWASLTSATTPDASKIAAVNGVTGVYMGLTAPVLIVSVAATTTVYLSGLASFGSGTVGAGGTLTAVRL